MDYTFLFDSSLEHYIAKLFVIRCFDDRFRAVFEGFMTSLGIDHLDPESVAGGVKVIASPEKESDRDFMIRELEKSIRLHHTARIVLFSHHDCGAYGGFTKFENDREKELAFHTEEHKKAQQIIKAQFPEMQIESFFIDEKGIIKIF